MFSKNRAKPFARDRHRDRVRQTHAVAQTDAETHTNRNRQKIQKVSFKQVQIKTHETDRGQKAQGARRIQN